MHFKLISGYFFGYQLLFSALDLNTHTGNRLKLYLNRNRDMSGVLFLSQLGQKECTDLLYVETSVETSVSSSRSGGDEMCCRARLVCRRPFGAAGSEVFAVMLRGRSTSLHLKESFQRTWWKMSFQGNLRTSNGLFFGGGGGGGWAGIMWWQSVLWWPNGIKRHCGWRRDRNWILFLEETKNQSIVESVPCGHFLKINC